MITLLLYQYQLSKYMSLPLYHLDQINWKDDNQTIEQDELRYLDTTILDY